MAQAVKQNEQMLGIDESLTEGQYLSSPNDCYFAVMQGDGNFVLYVSKHFHQKNALWSSNTFGKGSKPYKLVMQSDNNLVIYDGFGTATWASNTYKKGTVGAKLYMQSDGNLVIYDGDTKPIWDSGTCRN